VLDDLGDPVRRLIRLLLDMLDGTDPGGIIEQIAVEARRDRQRRAEVAARRVPVRLLFPLVTCILPAFGLLTVVPLVAGSFQSLTV
jgi:pilus assembly protein TadC